MPLGRHQPRLRQTNAFSTHAGATVLEEIIGNDLDQMVRPALRKRFGQEKRFQEPFSTLKPASLLEKKRLLKPFFRPNPVSNLPIRPDAEALTATGADRHAGVHVDGRATHTKFIIQR